MFKLKHLEVGGFRSFSRAAISFRPVNWLVGINGAGKSNLLSLFRLLHESALGRLQYEVGTAGGAERLLHYGAKVTPVLSVRVVLTQGAEDVEYQLELAAAADDRLFVSKEAIGVAPLVQLGGGQRETLLASYNPDDARLNVDEEALRFVETTPGLPWSNVDRLRRSLPELVRAALRADAGREQSFVAEALQGGVPSGAIHDVIRAANAFCAQLRTWRVYHFNDTSPNAAVRKSALLSDNQFLSSDGSNLPAFLYRLQRRDPSSYEQIRDVVRRIAPYFADFELTPDPLNRERILLQWRELRSQKRFTVSDLSDGTLRFICLATLLLQPEPPPLLLVDEPELGLHPAALEILASLLQMAAQDRQIIIATQSVDLLDEEEDAENVLVADRDPEGQTSLRRLERAALGEWLEKYTLGNLWKKNVPGFGGRP